MTAAAEAVLLGFSSGPACLAACGPALIPWVVSERRTPAGSAALLGVFLSGRLAGYLAFAAIAWQAGSALPADMRVRSTIFGIAYTGTALILGVYAAGVWKAPAHACGGHCPGNRPARFGPRFGLAAPAVLGLMTGLNLCPPFLAAAVRATTAPSLPAALMFFVLFFAGTAVWTLPVAAAGLLRRLEAVAFVARLTMALIAVYYGYLGVIALYRSLPNG